MEAVLDVIFVLIMIFGIISILFSLPGNVIILAAALLYGFLTDFKELGLSQYIILSIILIIGETVENLAAAIGAKKYGASGAGMVGSIIGGIIGAILGATFLLGLGAIPGVFIGVFVGAVVTEVFKGKKLREAVRAGVGAFWGRAFGILVKIIAGLTMIFITVKAVYF